MRTTIDIPDELFRQIKARAALRGMKLKHYVTEALRDSLFRHEPVSEVGETKTEYGVELSLVRACVAVGSGREADGGPLVRRSAPRPGEQGRQRSQLRRPTI